MSYIPRGIRNNNPGNINFAHQAGAVLEPKTDKVSEPRFACFPEDPKDPEKAKRQGLALLRDQLILNYSTHKLHTVKENISRWAPPSENNTSAYISGVAHSVGVEPDTVIPKLTPTIMIGLMNAIIRYENGTNPYGSLVAEIANQANYSSLIA